MAEQEFLKISSDTDNSDALHELKDGHKVSWSDNEATCRCLMGAFFHFYGPNPFADNAIRSKISDLFPKFGTSFEFNDAEETTFEDLIKVLEEVQI